MFGNEIEELKEEIRRARREYLLFWAITMTGFTIVQWLKDRY